jgi:hypothetical protein
MDCTWTLELKTLDLYSMSSVDYVLVLGEHKSGRKTVCAKFFDSFTPRTTKVLMIYDTPRALCESLLQHQHGYAIITTVLPSDKNIRKPTMIVFTPPVEIEWEDYRRTVSDMCKAYGVTEDIMPEFDAWRCRYPSHALVFKVPFGDAYVLKF